MYVQLLGSGGIFYPTYRIGILQNFKKLQN